MVHVCVVRPDISRHNVISCDTREPRSCFTFERDCLLTFHVSQDVCRVCATSAPCMVHICVFRTDLHVMTHVVTSVIVTRVSHVLGSHCNVTVCLLLMRRKTYAECVPPLHHAWFTFCVFHTDLLIMTSFLLTRISHVHGTHCNVTVCLLLMCCEAHAKCVPPLHHAWFAFVLFVQTMTS
jgi:hypothetical protein